ncbi:hypothetical protein SDC9_181630 [bioreactor metagenome]|uniref:Uncharacterized protein n=1 Tax=bioreactor metagenome TaxID=1076179 RepID=A0A645H541_9ZZZZ
MLRRAAQQSLDSSDQLRKGERLDQIIVGASLQTVDPVFHFTQRGQHQDRGLFLGTQGSQQGKSVHARQHGVQDDGGVIKLQTHVKSGYSVMGKVDNEACRTQSFLQILGKLLLIFDNQ